MSGMGQSHQFDKATVTSGLRRRADILRMGGHVSKVLSGCWPVDPFTSAAAAWAEVGEKKKAPDGGLTLASGNALFRRRQLFAFALDQRICLCGPDAVS